MFSLHIQNKIDEIVREFPLVDFSNRDQYAGALILAYHTMVASEPLLKICAGQEKIPGYFTEHEAEERGHEKWMEKDIRSLGFEVKTIAPFDEIIDMVGWQYYVCSHVSPLALLGYMAVIEGYPQAERNIRRLQELYPDSSYTMAYHAENDRRHKEDLMEEIDRVPKEWQFLVEQSAVRTAQLYHDALWRLTVTLKG